MLCPCWATLNWVADLRLVASLTIVGTVLWISVFATVHAADAAGKAAAQKTKKQDPRPRRDLLKTADGVDIQPPTIQATAARKRCP